MNFNVGKVLTILTFLFFILIFIKVAILKLVK